MREAARITSVPALLELRAAVVKFTEAAGNAVVEADMEARRMVDWLAGEAMQHWQREIRKRHDAVELARAELRRVQFTIEDRTPAAVEQKKALARAEAGLEEARRKLESTQRWSRVIDRQVAEYRGLTQTLSSMLDTDMPRAAATLERAVQSVEGYLAVTSEQTGDPGVKSGLKAGGDAASMARASGGPDIVAGTAAFPLPLSRKHLRALRTALPTPEQRSAAKPDRTLVESLSPPLHTHAPEDARAAVHQLTAEPCMPEEGSMITLSPDVAGSAWLVWLRGPSDAPESDSGWHVMPCGPQAVASSTRIVQVSVREMTIAAASLREFLALPVGWLFISGPNDQLFLYPPGSTQPKPLPITQQ